MPRMTGARLFAEMMQGYGVTHIFFVPAFMLKAFAEMEDMPIKRVLTHGEKAAVYMADGYARASGKPSVCMAQAIGASNLAAGLRDGYMAGSPIIAITGGPPNQSRCFRAHPAVAALMSRTPCVQRRVRGQFAPDTHDRQCRRPRSPAKPRTRALATRCRRRGDTSLAGRCSVARRRRAPVASAPSPGVARGPGARGCAARHADRRSGR